MKCLMALSSPAVGQRWTVYYATAAPAAKTCYVRNWLSLRFREEGSAQVQGNLCYMSASIPSSRSQVVFWTADAVVAWENANNMKTAS